MMKQILFAGVIGLFLTLVGTPLLIKLLARKGYSAGLAFSVVREALADDERGGDDVHVTDLIEPPED